MPELQETRDGAVLHLVLSSPARRNALTRPMLDALVTALAAARAADPPVRAVVLSGDPDGGAFSSGFDLSSVDDEEKARGFDPIDEPARAIEDAGLPVMAAIEGAAMGGALELACACSFRVAASTARFAMPPARLGLSYSASGLERFLRLATPGACRRIFLTGAPFGGEEAARLGLVEEVTPAGGAVARALELARRIAGNAPLAVAGLQAAIHRLAEAPMSDEDREAIQAIRNRTVHSEDLAEGIRAFREKRTPRFRGR